MQNAGATVHGVSGLEYDGSGWYHTTDFELGELYAKLLQDEPGIAVMNLGRRGEKPQPQVSLHLTHLPLLPGFKLESPLGELRCPEFLQQWWWDELYDYQLEAVRQIRTLHGVIEADDLGCVSGDAVVQVMRAGRSFKITLEELYRKWVEPFRWKVSGWNPKIPTHVRALCGDVFHQHELKSVVSMGEKPTVRIRLDSGHELCVTDDHEIASELDDRGELCWVPAGELTPGDTVLVKGEASCKLCGSTKVARVLSVEVAGVKPVYDLKLADPYHNFVANGVVVHNCGKTRTCIAAAKPPVVVLCKKSDAFVWKSELTYAEVPFAVIGSRQVGLQIFEDNKDALFWIIPYSVAPNWVPYFADIGIGPTALTVIADEAHEVQNRHTKAAEALRTIGYERGMFVSATAQRNRLQSLWGILDLSCAGRPFGSHWEFRERYCGAKHNGYGLEDGVPSAQDVARLRKRIAPILIKRTKRQIGQVLPPMERRLHKIEMAPESRKFLLESVGQLMDPEVFHAEGGKGGQHLVAINAFRRAVGTQKAMLAVGVIANRICEWGRGVIWIHHKEVGMILRNELKHRGIDVSSIQGSTSLKVREAIAQDWKYGELRPEKPKALIASISAANTALSFTTCGYQAFLEYDWSNIQMMQAEARLNRTGQQHPNILSEYFVIPGTIDEHLGRIVVEKAREAEAVLGEDGQVDQVQTILGSEEESDSDFMKRLAMRLAAGEM